MRDHIIGAVGSRLAKLCPANRPDVALYDMYRWRSRMDNLADLADQGKLNTLRWTGDDAGDVGRA